MKKLYKFFWDCYRGGCVEGVFAEEEEEVAKIIGEEIYFGEILGKHSEVCGTIKKNDIKVLSEDQDFIEKFEQIVGSTGYNPVSYFRDREE